MKLESLFLKALFAASFLLAFAVMVSMLRLHPAPVRLADRTHSSAPTGNACPLPPDGVICFRG